MKTKIELPNWVYEVFYKYHNVALPNACMKMNRQKLKEHLEKRLHCKIQLRLVEPKTENLFRVNQFSQIKPYLIAEEEK